MRRIIEAKRAGKHDQMRVNSFLFLCARTLDEGRMRFSALFVTASGFVEERRRQRQPIDNK